MTAAPLAIAGALDGPMLARIRAEMRAAPGADAGVLGVEPGRRVASVARRTTRVAVPDATRAAVEELLERHRPRIAAHFGRALAGCEEPQFLRYGPGDYFVAHQDGNTPLIHDETRFRKVSVVIALSKRAEEPQPGDYGGGALVIDGEPLAPAPGTLLAFPSETTHEVTPVTHGERLTIASWYRGG